MGPQSRNCPESLLSAVLLILITSWSVHAQSYTISTFAGGGPSVNVPGTSTQLVGPAGIAVDKAGNIYFSDYYSAALIPGYNGNRVLRLDAATGLLSVFAGNGAPGFSGDGGPATSAELNGPVGIALDSAGNLLIADSNNNRIRKVTNGVITTIAGGGLTGGGSSGDNGPATSALLNRPAGVALDSVGNLYIADSSNFQVRKVTNGIITTVAGNALGGFNGDNGPATSAEMTLVSGVAVDSAGNLYIADYLNGRIRRVSNGVITTVAGGGQCGVLTVGGPCLSGDGGPAIGAYLGDPTDVVVDSAGNLYIASGSSIRKVSGGVISTVAGNGNFGFSGDNGPATSAELNLGELGSVAVDSAGSLYIADELNNRIRKVSKGLITTVAGGYTGGNNIPAKSALLKQPSGVAVDSAGNLYVADTGNYRVCKISNGVITTVAGNGTPGFSGENGPASSVQLAGPTGVAVDSEGALYVADEGRIRKVSNGFITTVAGGGTSLSDNVPATSAQMNPNGVAVDSAGNLYIADVGSNRIRKVSTSGVLTTVAGNGTPGFSGDGGPATSASLHYPGSIAVNSAGNLYIADGLNNRIREVSGGVITTTAGNGALGFSGDNGPATSAELYYPGGVAVDFSGNLYIADSYLRKVSNGIITTVAGNGNFGFSGDNGPATSAELTATGVAVDSAGNVYVADQSNNRIRLLTPNALVNEAVAIASSASASYQGGVAPGSLISVYGANLAPVASTGFSIPLPTSFSGTSVTINGVAAPLLYVGPSQINAQVPPGTALGPATVVVTGTATQGTGTVTILEAAPGLFADGTGRAAALHQDDSFVTAASPAGGGEYVTFYGTGQGPLNVTPPAGQAAGSGAKLSSCLDTVTVTMNGVTSSGQYNFCGLASGFVGLTQINAAVPAGLPAGDVQVVVTINGVSSLPAVLAVSGQ